MSTSPVVDRAAANVKTRRVWSVVLLNVVTLGIYGVVWYYKINRELHDFGAAHGDCELAWSPSWLPFLVFGSGEQFGLISCLSMTRRVQAAERIAFGYAKPITLAWIWLGLSMVLPCAAFLHGFGVVGFVGSVTCLMAAMGLVQSRLNALWREATCPAGNSPADASRRYADTVWH
jgi:Domain of unknown function (DUF4234)